MQSTSGKLSTTRPALENPLDPPATLSPLEFLNPKVEISAVRSLDLATAATEQIMSKMINGTGIALLSQAENLSESVLNLLDQES